MALRNLNIKHVYRSNNNDIIKEFYIPLLSNSTNYDRVSAYFDSKILSLYSSGIEQIYMNGGKVRFIFSYDLNEYDYNLMKEGYENKDKIEKELTDKIYSSDVDIDFSNLAFLISIGVVEIKIAFTKYGIFHDKFGLIYQNDDYVYFRGSNNETVAAIINNYESFETTTSWNCDDNERKKINEAVNNFNNLWEDKIDGVIVKDIPQCVKEKIIKYSKGKI